MIDDRLAKGHIFVLNLRGLFQLFTFAPTRPDLVVVFLKFTYF